MGFRSLRVINEDRVAPQGGFNTHPHRDMEIITYVLEGALAHKDSLGNGAEIRPGEIQRMSAGTGILHSEFNASDSKPVHLLQIWIIPDRAGGKPGYAQQPIVPSSVSGKFGLLASREGREGSVSIQQDADLWLAKLAKGQKRNLICVRAAAPGCRWRAVRVTLDKTNLTAGDGANWEDAGPARFTAPKTARFCCSIWVIVKRHSCISWNPD